MSPIAFLGLATPVLLGVICGALRLFADPEAAIGALNRYALYLAFPALIVAGLTDRSFREPDQPWAWAIPLVAMLLSAGLIRLVTPRSSGQAGTLVLCTVFGNVAYVGLPLCVSVLGEQALGTAALAVSVFVFGSLVFGPAALVRWSPGSGPAPSVTLVLRQPLFWSPFVGLAARMLPVAQLNDLNALIKPVGASAAPVALFLLGVYLWLHRSKVARIRLPGLAHVATKLVLFPAVMWACVAAAQAAGWHDPMTARVFLLLSACPTAIATFALAQDLGTGRDRVAQAIVGSTIASVLVLPLAVALTA